MSLFDLPKEILNYIPLDPISNSNLRATCKYMRKHVKDNAKQFRLSSDYNINMRLACELGYLELAQLYKSRGAGAFTASLADACFGGHLEIAEWCFTHTNGANFDYALKRAREGGHEHVIEWCKKTKFDWNL